MDYHVVRQKHCPPLGICSVLPAKGFYLCSCRGQSAPPPSIPPSHRVSTPFWHAYKSSLAGMLQRWSESHHICSHIPVALHKSIPLKLGWQGRWLPAEYHVMTLWHIKFLQLAGAAHRNRATAALCWCQITDHQAKECT